MSNQRKDLYRVVMQCFDAPGAAPYPDHFLQLYSSEDEAFNAAEKSALFEFNELKEGQRFSPEEGEFVFDDYGDPDFDFTIRLYEGPPSENGRDFYNITLYNIERVETTDSGYMYRGFSISDNEPVYSVTINSETTEFFELADILKYIDDVILNKENERNRTEHGMYKNCKYPSFFDYFQAQREVYSRPSLDNMVENAELRKGQQSNGEVIQHGEKAKD